MALYYIAGTLLKIHLGKMILIVLRVRLAKTVTHIAVPFRAEWRYRVTRKYRFVPARPGLQTQV